MDLPPDSALRALAEILLRDRFGAWLHLNSRGIVLGSGGDWERYATEKPCVGQAGTESILALEGLLPTHEVLQFHSIEWSPERAADLHVIPISDGYWVCLLDCSTQTQERRHWQQLEHDADLMGADFARQTLRLFREDPLGFSNHRALFLWDEAQGFRLQSPWHPWLQSFVFSRDEPILAPPDSTSFLGNFLVDVLEFFKSPQPGSLTSGEWEETDPQDQTLSLEAMALMDSAGSCGLILQHLQRHSTHDHALLQGVRESNLTLELLRSETHKKEVLLQCIVHDLRGPLASMSGVLSILGKPGLTAEKRTLLLEIAQRQALRQDEMMREVLSVVASEMRELQQVERSLERAPDLCAVVRATVTDRRPAFQAVGIELSIEVSGPGPWKVPGNENQLGRVIGNLLDNARRFGPAGSVVQVVLRELEAPARLELHVLDRGPGVSPDLQARLFQRFSRDGGGLAGSPAAGGTVGLGLFFCRTSVEFWGGQVGYGERPQGGADFWIRLPRLLPAP